jgi:hypothetical protein
MTKVAKERVSLPRPDKSGRGNLGKGDGCGHCNARLRSQWLLFLDGKGLTVP